MKKCRDCHAEIENRRKLCDSCKAKADERSRLKELELKRILNAERKLEIRKCETEECTNQITGRRIYCDACKKKRRIAAQNERNKSPYSKPRRTGYEWLDRINEHLRKNGGVYYRRNE